MIKLPKNERKLVNLSSNTSIIDRPRAPNKARAMKSSNTKDILKL